jgi:hypothetical protein
MMAELWTRRQTCVRGLGDHGHYAIPVWRNLLELCGMVRGARQNPATRTLRRDMARKKGAPCRRRWLESLDDMGLEDLGLSRGLDTRLLHLRP